LNKALFIAFIITVIVSSLFIDSNSSTGSDSQVTARKVGESVTTAFDVMATAINYPLGETMDVLFVSYVNIPSETDHNVCILYIYAPFQLYQGI